MKVTLSLNERILVDIPNDKRILVSPSQNLQFQDSLVGTQSTEFKPRGLWYSLGMEWIEFLRDEMPNGAKNRTYLYEIQINPSKVLIIDTEEKFIEFNSIYSIQNDEYVDWKKVAQSYSGIEIAPYMWTFRMSHMWYYGWDVASGCIWKKDGIENIKLITDKWKDEGAEKQELLNKFGLSPEEIQQLMAQKEEETDPDGVYSDQHTTENTNY